MRNPWILTHKSRLTKLDRPSAALTTDFNNETQSLTFWFRIIDWKRTHSRRWKFHQNPTVWTTNKNKSLTILKFAKTREMAVNSSNNFVSYHLSNGALPMNCHTGRRQRWKFRMHITKLPLERNGRIKVGIEDGGINWNLSILSYPSGVTMVIGQSWILFSGEMNMNEAYNDDAMTTSLTARKSAEYLFRF